MLDAKPVKDHRPLILIVDDIRTNQQILAELLKSDYRLKVAGSGVKALEIARRYPDLALILLDIMMPEMDGYEVCKQLKQDPLTREIPVIFITAIDDEESESYGLQLGAVDYITKPIKPQITKLRVQKNIVLRQYQEKLSFSAEIIKHSKEAIIISDAESCIIDVNDAFTHITGYSREEVIGQNPRMFHSGLQSAEVYQAMWHEINTNGYWTGELWNRNKQGEVYPEWVTILAILNPLNRVTHYVGIASDISLLKQHQVELEQLAKFDVLTGVPNRMLLGERMQAAIAQTRQGQNLLGLCYLDLDGFKPINDELGHTAGDEVLITITKRIQQVIQPDDTLARLGGDEFAIVLLGLTQPQDYIKRVQAILDAISQPIVLNDKSRLLTASIGVTLFPLDDAEPNTLLRHADHAMYVAKQSGKNCFHLYDPAQDAEMLMQHESIQRITQGFAQQEFEVFYQPKIHLRSGKPVGAEALVRWRHPERGLLYPGQFLPTIENHDFIITLGDWVIDTALAQLGQWLAKGLELQLSVNIARRQLQAADFLQKLTNLLTRYPAIAAHLLELEILETSALEIGQSAQIIQAIRQQLGVAFALDDFGTGYSSLTYLKALPVLTLKIDQTFVRDMLEDPSDRAIVQAIIGLANTFKRKTVAEGIESNEHLESLVALGCEVGQGYAIAPPMSAADFAVWHANHWHE